MPTSESGLSNRSQNQKVREADDVVSAVANTTDEAVLRLENLTRLVHYNPEFDSLSSEPMLDACSSRAQQHPATAARFSS
jgi:hypothetical protein